MMECSWIMVWIPSKQRENTNKKKSSRKICRLFSEEQTSDPIIEKKENKSFGVQTSLDKGFLDTKDVPKKDDEEDSGKEKKIHIKENTEIEKTGSTLIKESLDEKDLSKVVVDSGVKNSPKRFQIERQNTSEISKDEKVEKQRILKCKTRIQHRKRQV